MLIRALILLVLALSLTAHTRASEPVTDPETVREHLLLQIDTLQQAAEAQDAASRPDHFEALRSRIWALEDWQLSLVADAISSVQIQAPGLDAIVFPPPEIPVECEEITPEYGFDTALTANLLADILAVGKWICLKTIDGNNVAGVCTVVSIAATAAEYLYRKAELCLASQRSARQKATFETQSNIAKHLNKYVNATVSSRASQTSLDAVQTDLTTELGYLNNLATSVAQDVSDLGAEVTNISVSIAALKTAAIDMTSVSEDVLLKTLVAHDEIGEADELAADVQQQMEIIRNHTQQISASVQSLEVLIDQLSSSADNHIARDFDASLGRAMADPNFNIIRYRLPATMGGELERSRELLVRTILDFAGIGVDTSKAEQFLATGDEQFNAGLYLSAYHGYSQAYRMLLQPSTVRSP